MLFLAKGKKANKRRNDPKEKKPRSSAPTISAAPNAPPARSFGGAFHITNKSYSNWQSVQDEYRWSTALCWNCEQALELPAPTWQNSSPFYFVHQKLLTWKRIQLLHAICQMALHRKQTEYRQLTLCWCISTSLVSRKCTQSSIKTPNINPRSALPTKRQLQKKDDSPPLPSLPKEESSGSPTYIETNHQ